MAVLLWDHATSQSRAAKWVEAVVALLMFVEAAAATLSALARYLEPIARIQLL